MTIKSVFQDNEGRVVLWQWPNAALWGWIVFKVLSVLLEDGRLKSGCGQLSMAFLFTWAYLEITHRTSYFRAGLGLVILSLMLRQYFR